MKTLIVLSALAAVAIAGPTIPGDDVTNFDVTRIGKRSPHLDLHKGHHIAAPIHHLPVVHHTYVQPVIPHHLGLKKPILFNQHHGHHGHLYRTEDEEVEVEAHSAESKEAKTKCMKDMEAKCDDEVIAKSSELIDGVQIEDVEENISESEVAQSLQMAKEAVNSLQRKLQKAEKNSRMTQWKQGELESDVKLQRDVETARQALDHMQLNFGNLESMNVHATTFKEADVQNSHLELTKSEQERIAQWKDAIENIQKNVELVKNIEDSFQNTEHSEMKSAALENSSSLKQVQNEDQKPSLAVAAREEQDGFSKDAAEMRMDGKSTDVKSSWKALAHENSAAIESSNSKNDMESSASTLSESHATLHGANEHHVQSPKSEHVQSLSKSHKGSQHSHSSQGSHASTHSQINLGTTSSHNARQLGLGHGHIKKSRDDEQSAMLTEGKMSEKQMEPPSLVKAMKSSEGTELTQLNHENSLPTVIDTTNLMKSADIQSQAESIDSKDKLEKSSLKTDEASKFEDSSLKHDEIEAKSMEHAKSALLDNSEAIESKPLVSSSSFQGSVQGKSAEHEIMMKSSDQMAGQSQQSEVATMALQHMPSGHQSEKSKHLYSFGVHSKSADGVSDGAFVQTSLNGQHSSFKSSLDAPKSMAWKDANHHGSSRGAYGSGLSLGGGSIGSSYGGGSVGSSYGAGAGSGAVGVFPNAHVGGCAIPLLLSCSPNVVAGHLAKSHSSYSAPSYASSSYRNTENMNTHSKRDITKIGVPTKVKRTPTRNLKQKSILIADRL